MTDKENLYRILQTLTNIHLDFKCNYYYFHSKPTNKEPCDLSMIGAIVYSKRFLACFLEQNIKEHVIPGEYLDWNDNDTDFSLSDFSFLKMKGHFLDNEEKLYLKNNLEIPFSKLSGMTDIDDSCIRILQNDLDIMINNINIFLYKIIKFNFYVIILLYNYYN